MTTALTFLFMVHPLKYFGNSNLKGRIKGYTYGAPPIFDKSVASIFEGALINVVNGFDLVPRLSFGSLKDLDLAIMEFHEREVSFSLEKIIKFCLEN